MNRNWDRRDFLKMAAGSLGVGLLPLVGGPGPRDLLGTRGGAGPSAKPWAGGASGPEVRGGGGLPPRVVGLRTLGGNFRFDPEGLRVEEGSTLTWLNVGDFHTTTAFHPDHSNLLPGDVPLRIPEGAEPWHSGMLGMTAGTEFEYTFRVPGVYDYFCQPHYSFGMVGRIVVEEPRDGPAVRRPLSELNEASRKQMPAVETIMGPKGRSFEWSARLNGLLLLRAHEEPAAAPAEALADAAGDDALHDVLSEDQASSFRRRLDAVVEGARGEPAYQDLLDRVDAAKGVLREVVRGS